MYSTHYFVVLFISSFGTVSLQLASYISNSVADILHFQITLQRMFFNLLHPAVELKQWVEEATKTERAHKLFHLRKSAGHQLLKTQHVL